jgi:nucleoside-diphosphate-sugar epimerase
MELSGKTVLVTGATGFIGGRLVEKLILEHNVRVRALVRDFRSAAWLSRTSAELIPGDVKDKAVLSDAVQGCCVVFHCAAIASPDFDDSYQVNVVGTQNLLEAASVAHVEKVVLVSSVAIHRQPDDGKPIDEATPFVGDDADAYARTKLAQELYAAQFCQQHDLPLVILRPTIVYGPRAKFWTVDYAQRLGQNRMAWAANLKGAQNFVYVDDLVGTLILAAIRPIKSGEAFIIGAKDSLLWKTYLSFYASLCHTKIPDWPFWLLLAQAFTFDRLDAWLIALRKRVVFWKRPLIFAVRVARKLLKPLRRTDQGFPGGALLRYIQSSPHLGLGAKNGIGRHQGRYRGLAESAELSAIVQSLMDHRCRSRKHVPLQD